MFSERWLVQKTFRTAVLDKSRTASAATDGWQVKKIEASGANRVITWADGNAEFDNVATDLTALTYA